MTDAKTPPTPAQAVDLLQLQQEHAALQQRQLEIEAIISKSTSCRGRRGGCCKTKSSSGCCLKDTTSDTVNVPMGWRFEFLRAVAFNLFIGLPIAWIGSLWVTATFALSAATSIYLVGLVLLPLFALSWRALAKLELKAVSLVGERWRVIPASGRLFPARSTFFQSVKALVFDLQTVRSTIYFMFVKTPLAYASFYLTIAPLILLYHAFAAVFFIFRNQEALINGTFVMSGGDDQSSTNGNVALPPHGKHPNHHHDDPNGPPPPIPPTSPSSGSWSGSWAASASAASAAASMMGPSGMMSIVKPHDWAENEDMSTVGVSIMQWLAAHPAILVMAIPLAIFFAVLCVKAIVQLARLQRIIAIALLASSAASSDLPPNSSGYAALPTTDMITMSQLPEYQGPSTLPTAAEEKA